MVTLSREQFQKEAFPFMEEIYASALRMARQKESAEDLVSEVYTRAWKSYSQFEPGTNMRAWLYKILTNTFINHYRQKQRQPGMVNLDQPIGDKDPGEGASLYDRLADTAPKPEEILANRFLERDLSKAIESLPEDFRMVVLLCDVQSFSYQEAADMLEIPIGTVRSRLFRGRRLLQKILWEQAVSTGVVNTQGRVAMNCKEALEKIYEFLDKDDSVPLSEIESHLDWCRGCWDRFEFEKRLIARIKQSCCKETCPDTLRKRIEALLEKY